MNDTQSKLIEAATAQIGTKYEFTFQGETTFYTHSYGSAKEGRFGVYVIPVERRTTAMRNHYRITYYLDGNRVNKAKFEQEVGA
jgi:hypothetical protein